MTREAWVRIYGEEFVEWMYLSPAERWRQSCRLWETFFLLGGRLDDDRGDGSCSGRVEDDVPTRYTGAPCDRSGVRSIRRLGV